MSQERLAELLGVTFQQVQKYEKGVNRVAASRLWDIAQALDLPVAAFYPTHTEGARRNDDPKRELRISEQLLAADHGVSFAKTYVEAHEDDQPVILAGARATADALATARAKRPKAKR